MQSYLHSKQSCKTQNIGDYLQQYEKSTDHILHRCIFLLLAHILLIFILKASFIVRFFFFLHSE